MVLFDLADASWFPLLMVIVIGGVMYLLYLSMRHEIGKIRVSRNDAATSSPESPAER
ncbi:MAG: hypothetical protein QM619_08640 [Micropruina sp.]|uniref:hypothetical protein n=1 Tax=Micropruina sp. TaxID=2737536 RepID=UPI0039E42A8D